MDSSRGSTKQMVQRQRISEAQLWRCRQTQSPQSMSMASSKLRYGFRAIRFIGSRRHVIGLSWPYLSGMGSWVLLIRLRVTKSLLRISIELLNDSSDEVVVGRARESSMSNNVQRSTLINSASRYDPSCWAEKIECDYIKSDRTGNITCYDN